MRKTLILVLLLLSIKMAAHAQLVEVIKFPQLEEIINSDKGGVKVINFWATWCKPCVEEIGYFERAQAQFKSKNVTVILVSFDFVQDLDKKVQRFVEKRGLQSRVLLLDETDYNSFIDKVSPAWSGAIPATLIVDGATGRKEFYEKTFKEGELPVVIEKFVN